MSEFVRDLGWRIVIAPSVLFATAAFLCGFLPVSPFATWSYGTIFLLTLPGLVGFADFCRRSHRKGAPRERDLLSSVYFPGWRRPLVRVTFVVVWLSFVATWVLLSIHGAPDIRNGIYVAAVHDRIIATIDRHRWLELRTEESRMFTGHLMIFGLIGLLAVYAPANEPGTRKRVSGRVRDRP